jgi:hypothetical protein
MPLIRSLVTSYYDGALPKDYYTNTVYHQNDSVPLFADVDWNNHCQQVLDCFTGNSAGYPLFSEWGSSRHVEVRCYDMADAEPRPEKAFKAAFTESAANDGPPELCVVLSFVAGRNIPGKRGRIYIGPWQNGDAKLRPSDSICAAVLQLGHSLFDVGGENVSHQLYRARASAGGTAGSHDVISEYSVANAWGVQRSRGLRASSRVTVTP